MNGENGPIRNDAGKVSGSVKQIANPITIVHAVTIRLTCWLILNPQVRRTSQSENDCINHAVQENSAENHHKPVASACTAINPEAHSPKGPKRANNEPRFRGNSS